MNERLTIQDLIDLLATKHSMAKKDAESFVKEFFLLIEQALENEKTVKIKGLGTFKLVDVDSRESVKVNTGERFQIKGHTKVSFSPDTALRDTINKPFAHFETVVLNENTVLDDTPVDEGDEDETSNEEPTIAETVVAEEINEQQAEIEEEVIAETIDEKIEELEDEQPVVIEETEIKTEEPEPVVEEPITIIEEPKPIIEEYRPLTEEPKPLSKEEAETLTAEEIIEQELLKANIKPEIPFIPPPEVVKPVKPAVVADKPAKKKEPQKEKSPVPYLITIIVLVLLLCGSVVLFIYYPDLFSSSPATEEVANLPETTQPAAPVVLPADTVERKDTVPEVAPVAPSVAVEPKPVAQQVKAAVKTESKPVQQQPSASAYLDSASYKITGTKTKYTIKEGETLTRVSLRFYGTKAMWPYIVKHNPDVIKNPNNVPYGTTVKIPELTKE